MPGILGVPRRVLAPRHVLPALEYPTGLDRIGRIELAEELRVEVHRLWVAAVAAVDAVSRLSSAHLVALRIPVAAANAAAVTAIAAAALAADGSIALVVVMMVLLVGGTVTGINCFRRRKATSSAGVLPTRRRWDAVDAAKSVGVGPRRDAAAGRLGTDPFHLSLSIGPQGERRGLTATIDVRVVKAERVAVTTDLTVDQLNHL